MSLDVTQILAVRRSNSDLWQLRVGADFPLSRIARWQHVDESGLITLQGTRIGALDKDFLAYLIEHRGTEYQRARDLEEMLCALRDRMRENT